MFNQRNMAFPVLLEDFLSISEHVFYQLSHANRRGSGVVSLRKATLSLKCSLVIGAA